MHLKTSDLFLQYVIDDVIGAVRDHCHITGKKQGAAHEYCNMVYFKLDPCRYSDQVQTDHWGDINDK